MDFINNKLQIQKWKARYIMQHFKCQRCGLCCIHHGDAEFSDEDWTRLKLKKRRDLLWHPLVDRELHDILSPIEAGYSRRELVKILATLKTQTGIAFPWGGLMHNCPFLKKLRSEKYQCLIQDVKPQGCKKFPVVWSGLNTGYVVCPGLKKLGVNCAPIRPNVPEKVT